MAPSGGNLQPWHFIVIEDQKIISTMGRIIREKIDDLPRMMEGCLENSNLKSSYLIYRFRKFSLFFCEAPVTIAVLVKFTDHNLPYIKYFTEKKGLNLYEANQYMGFIEIQSVAAAIENLLLAAHSLGYGACWMSIPFIGKDELKKTLKVQSPWDLIAMIPIGIQESYYTSPKVKRKKIEEIVTFL
jgi:nitroreductase